MWRCAVLACLLAVALACKQNAGRNCTVHEHEHGYIQVTAGPVQFPNSTRLLSITEIHPKLQQRQWRFFNPALLVYNSALWLFMRIESAGTWNDTLQWCPGNSLTDVEPCMKSPTVCADRMVIVGSVWWQNLAIARGTVIIFQIKP